MELIKVKVDGIEYTIEKEYSLLVKGDFFYEQDKGIFEFVEYSSFHHYGTNFPVGVVLSKQYRHNPLMCRKVIK
ncbi:hypothetical protein D3C87_485940 [compost metagenome]